MELVIGVRFNTAGKIYFFTPGDLIIERGDKVIVETIRGLEYGNVVLNPRELKEEEIKHPLKPVIRVATDEDRELFNSNQEKAEQALMEAKRIVTDLGLDMKLVKAMYTFDAEKLLFYFSAENRVDFRELVKILATRFHIRIELRQIGVRDATKQIGGVGSCGRPLCCSTFLSEFAPVGIKTVRAQNVSLNPSKISGHCGRLMCCLSYEENVYKELNKKVPRQGSRVKVIATGEEGTVNFVNLLRKEVKVLIDTGNDIEVAQFKAEELQVIKNAKNR